MTDCYPFLDATQGLTATPQAEIAVFLTERNQMNHAETCPVCNGRGTVDREYKKYLPAKPKPCHGCGGKGWVEVGTDYLTFPFPVPVAIPHPPSYPGYIIWSTC